MERIDDCTAGQRRMVYCGFSNYARFRRQISSRQMDLYGLTTIWIIFSSENVHALDFNTLEQQMPRHAALDVM